MSSKSFHNVTGVRNVLAKQITSLRKNLRSVPLGGFFHRELAVDPMFEFLHMGDDADGEMLSFEFFEAVHHHVHEVLVQRAESLVQKEKLDGTQRFAADLRAQRKRERERNEESLPARERIYAAGLPAVEVIADEKSPLQRVGTN